MALANQRPSLGKRVLMNDQAADMLRLRGRPHGGCRPLDSLG